MAKFGKKLFGLAVIGAAAAGVYYYLKKENEIPVNLEDEDDDFDNFDDSLEEAEATGKRSYVNLDFDTVESKAKEVAEKAGEFVKKSANTFESFVSQAGTKVEEFFDDKKSVDAVAQAEEAAEEVADAVEEAAEAVEEAVEDVTEEIKEDVTE